MIEVNRQTPARSQATRRQQEIGQGQQTERNRGDSMTQRERPAPDGGSQSAAGSPASLAAPLPPLLFAACADSSFWEQWYQRASTEQRRQVLDLAGHQGVLCSCQLPAVEQTARRSPFAELLAGSPRDLTPLEAPPIRPLDPELDETQRQAVARALGTPDVALIRGYPGSGKTRVTAELLRQADRLGLRVLFVGASAPAVDQVLERLAADPATR